METAHVLIDIELLRPNIVGTITAFCSLTWTCIKNAHKGYRPIYHIFREVNACCFSSCHSIRHKLRDVLIATSCGVAPIEFIALGNGHNGYNLKCWVEHAVALTQEVVTSRALTLCFFLISLFIEVASHLLDGRCRLEFQVGILRHDNRNGVFTNTIHTASAALPKFAQTITGRNTNYPAWFILMMPNGSCCLSSFSQSKRVSSDKLLLGFRASSFFVSNHRRRHEFAIQENSITEITRSIGHKHQIVQRSGEGIKTITMLVSHQAGAITLRVRKRHVARADSLRRKRQHHSQR